MQLETGLQTGRAMKAKGLTPFDSPGHRLRVCVRLVRLGRSVGRSVSGTVDPKGKLTHTHFEQCDPNCSNTCPDESAHSSSSSKLMSSVHMGLVGRRCFALFFNALLDLFIALELLCVYEHDVLSETPCQLHSGWHSHELSRRIAMWSS